MDDTHSNNRKLKIYLRYNDLNHWSLFGDKRMKAVEIAKFLDKELKIKKIKDSSVNGLQFNSKQDVQKVGFAVDACISTFNYAVEQNVDLLIVHHGIKWKPPRFLEVYWTREHFLKKNKLSLYAAHLPLDAHPEYGNNIGLAKVLGLKNIKMFAKYNGSFIGYMGAFDTKQSVSQIEKKLNITCRSYLFGARSIKTIGIVSGGGADAAEEAARKNLDCFLVGEINQGAYTRLQDLGMTTIVAGHYRTETFGVKSLQKLIEEKFELETVFIDNPTGI